MITAPYNFVPLNEKVFYPDWAEKVSHDIPFEDGESGVIDITITAKSPIFIRNHEVNTSNEKLYYTDGNGKKISTEFCHHKGRPYIPSSSVKGMIRNVLEIMSFSKIKIDQKHEKIMSVRDMTVEIYNGEKRYNYPMKAIGKKFGLLNLKSRTFIDYGEVVKIHYDEIEDMFPNYNYQENSIYNKYESIAPLSNIMVSEAFKDNNQYYTQRSIYVDAFNAKLFLNGHFGEGDNEKKYEFVLINKKENTGVQNRTIENFKTVYFHGTYKEKEPNKWTVGEYWEWKYDQDNNIEIPVFYIDIDGEKYFGLTQIFKLPYRHTFLDCLGNTINNKLDLVETIFGTVNKENNFLLKGRVQFSHFKSLGVKDEAYKNLNPIEQILSEPKPTYYPNYIEQNDLINNGVRRYKTLMDDDAKIRGWKRYPLRGRIKHYDLIINDEEEINHNVITKFKPLDTETKFKGKIRFHNLKKVEIGALLSALTFHDNQNRHYHNIGMAKSLGYGKIKIDISYIKTLKNKESSFAFTERNIRDYLKNYETYMLTFDNNWLQSEQLNELFSMTDITIQNDNNLIYQSLENSDFSNDKNNNRYLHKYSNIVNYNFRLNRKSTITLDDLVLPFLNKILRNNNYSLEDFYNYMNGNYSSIDDEIVEDFEELYDNEDFRNIEKLLEKYSKHSIDSNEKVKLLDFLLNFEELT